MFVRSFLSFLIVSLVSFSSFACPDLTGEWLCGNKQPNFKISSEEVLDTSFLKVIGNYDQANPDERIYILGAGSQYNNGASYSGSCNPNGVIITLRDSLDQKNDAELKESFILVDNNTLKIRLESNELTPKLSVTTCTKFSPLK